MKHQFFDIKRFNLLLGKELRFFFRRYALDLLCIGGAYLLFWLLNVFFSRFGSEVHMFSRYMVVVAMTAVSMIMAPSKVYKTINHRRYGLDYALLPASTMEKTVSMFICSSLTCLVSTLVLLFALDALVACISPNLFTGTLLAWGSANFWIQTAVSMLYLQSFFVLGNMLFKSHKVGGTLVGLFGIGFVCSMLMGGVIAAIGPEQLVAWLERIVGNPENWSGVTRIDAMDFESMPDMFDQLTSIPAIKKLLVVEYAGSFVIWALCWFGTFRLIKTTKY